MPSPTIRRRGWCVHAETEAHVKRLRGRVRRRGRSVHWRLLLLGRGNSKKFWRQKNLPDCSGQNIGWHASVARQAESHRQKTPRPLAKSARALALRGSASARNRVGCAKNQYPTLATGCRGLRSGGGGGDFEMFE